LAFPGMGGILKETRGEKELCTGGRGIHLSGHKKRKNPGANSARNRRFWGRGATSVVRCTSKKATNTLQRLRHKEVGKKQGNFADKYAQGEPSKMPKESVHGLIKGVQVRWGEWRKANSCQRDRQFATRNNHISPQGGGGKEKERGYGKRVGGGIARNYEGRGGKRKDHNQANQVESEKPDRGGMLGEGGTAAGQDQSQGEGATYVYSGQRGRCWGKYRLE